MARDITQGRFAMKGLVIAATGALALGIAAGAHAQEEEVTIGVSIPAATHGWTGGVNYHAERIKQRLEEQYDNLSIVIAAADGASQQANDLEDLMAVQQIDALVILPFESDPLTDPVRYVKEQGIFVTVVDRGLAQEGIEDLYVAGDNPGFGQLAGEYFTERLSEGDNIVVLRGIPTVIDDERVSAFSAAIEGSGINVLDMEHANWNRDDGFEVMQDFLSRHQDIDGVWAGDDDVALGVIEAIQQADRADEMFVVGGGGMKQMIERVSHGDELTPIDILYPPSMIATAIELTALRYVAAVPIEGTYILKSPIVTPENAEQYYFPDSPY
jgi:ribose transport system substrate-binding protein